MSTASEQPDPVLARFSRGGMAGKWNDMYEGDTPRLDEHKFRLRRDFTVACVQACVGNKGRVLDLGCGTAPVLSKLRERGIDCVGIDYSEDMLDLARQRLESMSLDASGLSQGDCRKTSFADASFDAIVCLGVISYVEDYAQVLTEIRRLLKPNGIAIISSRNRLNPILSDPIVASKALVRNLLGKQEREPYEIGRFMNHQEIAQKIVASGLSIDKFECIGFGPLKFGGRLIFRGKTSIKISNALTKLMRAVGMKGAMTRLTDIHIWVCSRSASTVGRME